MIIHQIHKYKYSHIYHSKPKPNLLIFQSAQSYNKSNLSCLGYSGNGAVVSGEFHDGQQRIVLDVEVELLVIEELIFLHALQFYAFEAEVAHTGFMLLAEEGIEDHAIDETLRLVHFLLAAVELHPYFLLALVHLLPQIVNRLLEHFEDVYRAVEVSYLAAHRYQHRAYKNPHFLLHLLRLYERHVEVHLLELQRILGVLLGVGVAGFVGRGLVMLALGSLSVLFWQSSSAAFAIVLVPPQRSYLSLQLLYAIFEISDPPFFLSEAHFLFRLSFPLPLLDAFALPCTFPLLPRAFFPVL